MANANIATGLTPRRLRNGSPWHGPLRTYFVPATDSTPLYIGDPVVIAGSADDNGYPTVTRATAGSTGRITGVVCGFRPSATFIANGYRAASTGEYALVCDDPHVLYEVQEDGIGGNLTANSVGLNVDLIAGTGNAYTKQSGFMLDSSTAATTATLQMRLVELQHRADTEIGNYAKWLVSINLPTETGAAGSTGV